MPPASPIGNPDCRPARDAAAGQAERRPARRRARHRRRAPPRRPPPRPAANPRPRNGGLAEGVTRLGCVLPGAAGEDLTMPKVLDNIITAAAPDPTTHTVALTWANGATTVCSFHHL